MDRNAAQPCPATQRARGFTLIEILVVVAIIALLISILLPSLSRAREQARAVACGSNLSQLIKAENQYQSQNREWMPGAPLTTGHFYATGGGANYSPTRARLSIQQFDWTTPLRVVMYGANSIPRATGNTPPAIKAAHAAIWKGATSGLFHCPSNPHQYYSYPKDAAYPLIPAASYLTLGSIVRAGPNVYNNPPPGADRNHIAQSPDWEVRTPAGYVPRHSRLGRESMKVFLLEGTRYYDAPTNEFDYDKTCNSIFSSFTASNSPAIAGTFAREYGMSREYSYRHRDKKGLQAAFFDGHVEMLFTDFRGLGPQDQGYAGTAVEPRWYWPTGSTINNPATLHKSGLQAGLTLP